VIHAVFLRERELVVTLPTSPRWPLCGLIGAVAWQFDGRRIVLSHAGRHLGTRATA
jgi:hypothetical protein